MDHPHLLNRMTASAAYPGYPSTRRKGGWANSRISLSLTVGVVPLTNGALATGLAGGYRATVLDIKKQDLALHIMTTQS